MTAIVDRCCADRVLLAASDVHSLAGGPSHEFRHPECPRAGIGSSHRCWGDADAGRIDTSVEKCAFRGFVDANPIYVKRLVLTDPLQLRRQLANERTLCRALLEPAKPLPVVHSVKN